MVDNANVHRWDAGVNGAVFVLQNVHHILNRARIGHDNDLGPFIQGIEHRHGHPVDVEERDGGHHLFATGLRGG